MDASAVAHGSPQTLLTHQSSFDRARERFFFVSEADPDSELQHHDSLSLANGVSSATKESVEADEYRQKLISVSYAESPLEQDNEVVDAVPHGKVEEQVDTQLIRK